MRTIHSLWFLCGLLALAPGCRRTLEGSIQGTVTLDTAPLNRGTVTFHPVSGGAAAYGRIQADGSYTITTGNSRGLSAGEYIVTVVATAAPSDTRKDVTGKLLTPLRYQNVGQSPLRFTVQRGGNKIDLPLVSK
jgi:hypothetical protein